MKIVRANPLVLAALPPGRLDAQFAELMETVWKCECARRTDAARLRRGACDRRGKS